MEKVSCIIPTYNEASRLGKVLRVVTTHQLIDEVVVVDDGSNDGTHQLLTQFPTVQVIRHAENKGKTAALHTGITHSRYPLLALLDADLIGLTEENITDLILPVKNDNSIISISLRKNAVLFHKIIGLDYISGERVFHRKILEPYLPSLEFLPKFGFEVFFNNIIIKYKYTLAVIHWNNVSSPYPTAKYGLLEGTRRFFGMIRDIFHTASIPVLISQYIGLYRLKRKYVKS